MQHACRQIIPWVYRIQISNFWLIKYIFSRTETLHISTLHIGAAKEWQAYIFFIFLLEVYAGWYIAKVWNSLWIRNCHSNSFDKTQHTFDPILCEYIYAVFLFFLSFFLPFFFLFSFLNPWCESCSFKNKQTDV